MKRLLREPLVHFVVLGAMIFCGYSLLNRDGVSAPGRIVITQGQIDAMMVGFTRTWQRPPTREEMAGLIRDRVQEEVYYREALALGLDRDDVVIRRRLRQKMEFVSHDPVANAEPSDEELQAYLKAHAGAFTTGPRFSFRQVYLNPQRHGRNLARDAQRLLVRLRQAGPRVPAELSGDSLMMEPSFDGASKREVTSLFGEKFAAALEDIPTGQWQGPVKSGYGVHLVFLSERAQSGLPPLAEAREAVRRQWADAQQRAAADRFYQELLRKYVVTIEAQPVSEGKLAPAAAR
jgi:hypothetical protein